MATLNINDRWVGSHHYCFTGYHRGRIVGGEYLPDAIPCSYIVNATSSYDGSHLCSIPDSTDNQEEKRERYSMNIRENVQTEPTKLLGVAAILQSVPLPLVYWTITVASIALAFMVWLFVAWLAVIAMAVFWLAVASIAFMTGKGLYNNYHDVMRTGYETRAVREQSRRLFIANETALAKLDMHKQLPQIAQYAINNGKNFEYGGLKISDWKSHVASLQGQQSIHQLSMPNVVLPAKSKMIEVARRHDFSKDNIFLALATSRDITTSLRSYLHCANDGNTDSGKTSNWRGQIVQFLLSGIDCLLLNPNFALVTKDGDDWKPIAKALQSQGSLELNLPRVVTELPNIGYVLDYMANTEIDRRFAMMREGNFDYKPLYLYIDEWPEIALKCKGANDNLGTLLRRGRAVELCVSVNSQGFLKEDTDLKGSARENFATAFFLGGSTYSGAKLLDIKQAELEDMLRVCNEPIGKGVAILRNNASMPNPEIVRLPYADNDFLYYTLGRDDSFRLPPESVVEVEDNSPVNDDLDRVYEACMQLETNGQRVSARAVAEITGYGKDKSNMLINKLKTQGIVLK